MKKFSAFLPVFCSLLAVAVVGASAGTLTVGSPSHYDEDGVVVRTTTDPDSVLNGSNVYTGTTSISGGTLTLNSASNYSSAGTINVAVNQVNQGGLLSATTTYNGATLISVGMVAGGFTLNGDGTFIFAATNLNHAKAPALSGSAGDLKITTTDGGNMTRVKTLLSLGNTGTKAAKNVTATVYLSDDNKLDASDTKIKTLHLKDYAPDAKLAKGQTLSLPIKQKVPTAIASYLEGKYIIAVLEADSPAVPVQVVVGPIHLAPTE